VSHSFSASYGNRDYCAVCGEHSVAHLTLEQLRERARLNGLRAIAVSRELREINQREQMQLDAREQAKQLSDAGRRVAAEFEFADPRRAQIAKSLTFPAEFVPYINWDSLGEARRDLASEMHVTMGADGSVTVVLSWPKEPEL
jgi:hypothetical protein